MTWIAWILIAYVLGSIPFGLLIGLASGVDIREHGSKNVGANNVGRVLGKPKGVLCFFLDGAKGAGPVLGAGLMTGVFDTNAFNMSAGDMAWWLAVACAAVVGHMYSVFLRFSGGKGVATGFGATLAMWPLLTAPVLLALAVWFITVKATRYVSLGSMLGAVATPVLTFIWFLAKPPGTDVDYTALERLLHVWPLLLATAALAVLVVYRHRSNIGRLLRGEEPKSNQRMEPTRDRAAM